MRQTTRSHYEQLRRRRKAMRADFTHRRRLTFGSGLLMVGVFLLAIALKAAPSQPLPSGAAVTDDEAQDSASLQATLVPVGGSSSAEPSAAAAARRGKVSVLFNTWRFTSEPGLTAEAIQSLLERHPGVLADQQISVGDRVHSFAEVLVGHSLLYGVNPKAVLAMMELQQGLLSDPDPQPEQLKWALNYHGDEGRMAGLDAQLRWSIRELRRGVRDFPGASELVFADKSREPLPPNLDAASYAILRTLAKTTTPGRLTDLASEGEQSFLTVYTRLFEDPRQPLPHRLPAPAEPFLSYPLERVSHITSFFDHEYPFLIQNGSLVSYWDRREAELSYDGHDGWDYGARPPTQILAAAPGKVVFAGNSNDGCGIPARGVIIEHGNGYRTLYWHLSRLSVEIGQTVARGEAIGVVGGTGCATGPHLHFQVHYLGRSTDPYGWCGAAASDPWAAHPVGIDSRWLWLDRVNPCELPQDVLVVATGDEGFATTGAWDAAPIGVRGESFWTRSQPPLTATLELTGTASLSETESPLSGVARSSTPEPGFFEEYAATATWRPALPAAGRYRVLAYVPYYYNGLSDARSVRYKVRHARGQSEVEVDQHLAANHWVDLGAYTFSPQAEAWVRLTNKTGEADEGIWAGAMLWIPLDS